MQDSRWGLTRAKGQNPLPRPAGHAALDAAQDTVGFPGCQGTLPAHGELLIHQYPQVLLLRAVQPMVRIYSVGFCVAFPQTQFNRDHGYF